MRDAVREVFGIFAGERDRALALCTAIAQSTDGQAALGAVELQAMLTELDPFLHPA